MKLRGQYAARIRPGQRVIEPDFVDLVDRGIAIRERIDNPQILVIGAGDNHVNDGAAKRPAAIYNRHVLGCASLGDQGARERIFEVVKQVIDAEQRHDTFFEKVPDILDKLLD
ncbi:MAG: hypothetical protein R3227_02830, partial [Reinekea sp.]|nr:hypothetical protein [Reinekea sp.]